MDGIRRECVSKITDIIHVSKNTAKLNITYVCVRDFYCL